MNTRVIKRKLIESNERCSFCGKGPADYQSIFSKQGVAICNHCLCLTNDIVTSNKLKRPSGFELCSCSFCAKRQMDGVSLIAGPSVFICNECSTHFYSMLPAWKLE
ncbi:ClpX C4-type zinc finger protein [Parahaliea mediterranea]|uniref:ClpX C4-type zinc finger protein n=1 Tax=Parahaliea mediterranea TaxID=651086 RepID=UPI001474A4FE|nr:ClpX C4-type zinc finger protein [Parahaliea mediterranea]